MMQSQETSALSLGVDDRYNGPKNDNFSIQVTKVEITDDSSTIEPDDSDSEAKVRERTLQSAEAFWAKNLANVPELAIHAITVERHGIFEAITSKSTVSVEGLSLRNFADSVGASVSSVLYTALGLVLDRHSQASSNTVVVGAQTLGQHDDFPLKLHLPPSSKVSEIIQSTDRFAIEAASNAFIGFENIKKEHAVASSDFKIVVASEGAAGRDHDNFPVCIVVQLDSTVSIMARHDTAIPEDNLQILLEQFMTALKNIIQNPLLSLSSISIMSEAEQSFLLEMAKPQSAPVHKNVQDIFESQVERTPAALALQFEDGKPLSYSELNSLANRMARRLPAARGSFVPVCLQRSINLVVTLLAILKTGAAYVVLDPDTPQERNDFIVNDVAADFVVVDHSTKGRFQNIDEFVVEDVIEGSRRARDTNLARSCDPSDPVYVIYTSGSTGKPKGVLHMHSSASSGLEAFPTLPKLRQLLFHNPVFSAAQRSVWSTLKQGGCLCLASKDNLTTHISRTINLMQINVIDVTPSTALLIEPGTVPCLRRMTVAGELINPALIPTWVNELELLNAYGLSENTQVNWRRKMILGQNPQNIGRPSDTTTAYVLTPGTTQLSPLLAPGELCLGGHQLAVHYINRPEKTAEAFIPNPFAPGRLYRTGDMVVPHTDGSIEMVGRIDFQVKINGQRVEPGDSNAIIQTHPEVHTSSVVSAVVGGRKSLVAVVVSKGNLDWPLLRSELKVMLKQHISGYMAPAYWLPEAELPLNVNGKIDIPKLSKYVESLSRDHLLASSTSRAVNSNNPSLTSEDSSDSDCQTVLTVLAELSPEGEEIREIWADILHLPVSSISADDYFEELGGSSLDAIRVASTAYQMNLEISVASILRQSLHQVVEGLKKARPEEEEAQAIEPFALVPRNLKIDLRGVDDAFPTTSLQDAFLADSLLGNSTYVYRRYYSLEGVSMAYIHAALDTLAKTNSILRSTFKLNKTSFLQVIRHSSTFSWEDSDLSADQFSSKPKFSMELGGSFVHFTNLQDKVLAVTMHHALFDFWSRDFIIDDLGSIVSGKALLSRPSYANYVHHLKQQDKTKMEAFWKSKFLGAASCHLGRKAGQNNVISVEIAEDIQGFAASHKISVGSLIYTAWAIVLAMHTSTDDILFGATLSGRDAAVSGILSMAGPTINTVPFRVHVDPQQGLLHLANEVQADIWTCSEPSKLGIRNILTAAGHKAGLYDTMVNILIREQLDVEHSSAPILKACGPVEPNYVDFTMLEAEVQSTGLRLSLLSQLEPRVASFILDNVVETIRTALRQPSSQISDINPISPAEVMFLEALSLEQPTKPEMLAHTLFEKMVAKFPTNTALRGLDDIALSYEELDSKANTLAHYIRSQGWASGSIIPICMKKSTNTLVAILAVLKSGAAFTPLDPKNPKDRNDFIVKDVGAAIAVTDNLHQEVFQDFDGTVINMDNFFSLDVMSPPILPGNLSPDDLAYIIYTSGSTGLPKGVQVSHCAVAASTEGMIEACKVNADWNVLWFLNYVFDASYFDVFTVLGSGGSICVVDQDALINDLAGYVNHFQVKQLMITPTISKLISPNQVPSLQMLLVCGEPITPEVVSTWASVMDVYNGYGPTEATILMTVSKVEVDGNLKSVGYPLKAVKAQILHPETLMPVPFGAAGELCVSGAQVAMGYLNRPEITASSFLKTEDGSVLYKTGDYARWLPNGEIECLGRKDSQVKLNGFRIELGEVENAILKNAGDLIQSCVAGVAQIRGKAGIVLYYVPVDTTDINEQKKRSEGSTGLASSSILDPEVILGRLTGLAHYMNPRLLLPFWSFPLLPSGKINRKSLKALVEELKPAILAQYAVAPGAAKIDVEDSGELTDMEKTLRSAWAELFDIDENNIQVSDLFYTYGGDSIAAINLVSMLRRLEVSLSVNDALSHPALRDQASCMKPSKSILINTAQKPYFVAQPVYDQLRVSGIEPDEVEEIYACAPGQVEFLTQGHTDDQFWQLMTVRKLPIGFDLDLWTELTRQLTSKNQILRALYLKQDENNPLSWCQVILKDPVMDMTFMDCDNEEQKTELVKRHWDQRFTLAKPFVKYLILRHVDGTMDLCTKLDHAMYDGTLLRIFDDQFSALRDGTPMPKAVPFKDFVAHTNNEAEKTKMLAFWRDHLKNNNFNYPEGIRNPKPSGVVVDKINLPVEAFAQTANVTASAVFQAAYSLLLARLDGNAQQKNSDVTYDYLLTGRNVDMDEPQLINGTCANFLPFRARWDRDNTPVAQLLRDTQDGFWRVTENGLVSLGDIYRALNVDRQRAAAKTLFLFQPFEPAAPGENDEHMRWIVMAMSKVTMFINYAIMFEVFKDVQGNRLKMQYDTRLFPAEYAKEVMKMYVDIVRDICSGKKTFVGQLW